jgi:CarD family transcriptional regulator
MSVPVSGKSKTAVRPAKPAKGAAAKPGAKSGKAANKPKVKAKPAAKAPSKLASKAVPKAPPKASPRAGLKPAPKVAQKAAAKPAAKPIVKPAKAVPKAALPASVETGQKKQIKSVAKASVSIPRPAAPASPASKVAAVVAEPRRIETARPAPGKFAPGGMAPRSGGSHMRRADRVEPPIAPSKMSAKMAKAQEKLFAPGDYVVYPTHGVGQIIGVEDQTVAGMSLRVFSISFESEKMILRVPVDKAKQAGLRAISTRKEMQTALTTLRGRARIKRVIWSRRAQEYEAKINSGSPTSIAEVVRDLHRATGQPDQSYSERQIYEAALDRLARELALVEEIDQPSAAKRVEKMLRVA